MKPEVIEMLDSLDVHMGGNGGMIALNIVLAIVMFGVALGIKPRTFIDILKSPKSVLVGIFCQLLILPALTFLLTITFKNWISPMIALGMILVASCPGGNISNFITSLSRGNTELSVSLTAFNTAACVFTTPLNFAFWGNMYINFAGKRDMVLPELQIPLSDVFVTIVILLGIPLVLGVLCAQYLPKVAKALKKPMQYLSIIFFVGMVCIAFGGNFGVFIKCIQYIFLIVLVHNLLALGIGFGTSTLLKMPYKDRRTITIETGIQNSGLGLALLLNPHIFNPEIWANNGGMLVITAWWGVWHIISGLTLAGLWRARGRKEENED
ncbi:MAG: bile acid:sodium symporter family protein [Bacteroidales bacterium]|nr:bile acid:sodium symporter family protein [Bacteroidales bacterium]